MSDVRDFVPADGHVPANDVRPVRDLTQAELVAWAAFVLASVAVTLAAIAFGLVVTR